MLVYYTKFNFFLKKSYKPFSAEHSIFKLTPVGRLVIRCSNFLLHHFSKSWAFLGPSSMKKLVNSTAKLNNAAIPIAGAPRTCKNVFTKVIFLMWKNKIWVGHFWTYVLCIFFGGKGAEDTKRWSRESVLLLHFQILHFKMSK